MKVEEEYKGKKEKGAAGSHGGGGGGRRSSNFQELPEKKTRLFLAEKIFKGRGKRRE